jgi:hypothetical protein
MISVDHYSCRMEGGPMDGAVVTGGDITDWGKNNNGTGSSGRKL